MKIAVVGGGVAGVYAAWHLARRHEVVLFEQHGRVGGHTDTHLVEGSEDRLAVDTGFIVFNPGHYPLFSAWLETLGVESRASDMSFGVSCRESGIEYNATDLDRLFCQRRNLVRPAFLRMAVDIVRFYRRAPALMRELDETETLGEWLARARVGRGFADWHLAPMAAALWSSPGQRILEFPMRYLLEFMHNHDMLRVSDRPIWRTVTGGSQRYVDAALARYRGGLVTRARVLRVTRWAEGGVRLAVETPEGRSEQTFDQVILASHADQALAMLDSPNGLEREVLGAFEFQTNDTVLHTDESLMPRHHRAWSSWNVCRHARGDHGGVGAGITYWMNLLQGLPGTTNFLVSLNQTDRIDPERVLARRQYHHPIYTPAARAAQRRLPEISGRDRIWYCGAWTGWGFHEDAVRSARGVVDEMLDKPVRHAA